MDEAFWRTIPAIDGALEACMQLRSAGYRLVPAHHSSGQGRDGLVHRYVTVSNRLVRFDPKTATFTDIALPHNGFMRWVSDTLVGVIMKVASWFPAQNLQL
jgi:hypothetical protein